MQASSGLYAVIGNPIQHSRSPQIHRLFAAQTGISLQYHHLLAPLDAFDASVDDFFSRGGKGLNVTVPFKLQAFERVGAHASARARAAGAVNTLWRQDGVLHGCNTDGAGLLNDLQRLGVELAGARVLLVGAGGAARGVLEPLLAAGCARIHIANRTEARAHALVEQFRPEAAPGVLSAGPTPQAVHPQGWQLVINATASTLSGDAPDLPGKLYAPAAWAYDMMYGATPTPFLKQAAASGAQTADGLGMLVEQAAESFQIWHGVRPETRNVLERLRFALDRGVDPQADLASISESGSAAR